MRQHHQTHQHRGALYGAVAHFFGKRKTNIIVIVMALPYISAEITKRIRIQIGKEEEG